MSTQKPAICGKRRIQALPLSPDRPDVYPGEISVPHQLCSSMTKAGKPCPNRCMGGETTCFSHSEGAIEQRKRATEASAKARSERVEARKEASEEAKLTITERLQRRVAERATQLVDSLVAAAEADGSSRAMDMVWNRIEGKVSDNLNLSSRTPFDMDEGALMAWLSQPAEEPKSTA